MKLRFSTDTIFRVFLRGGRGASLDKQREDAKAIVPLGATVQEVTDVDMLCRMTRPDDVVIVFRLEFVPPVRSKECPSPTFVLGQVKAALKGVRFIESHTQREPDEKRWREAVKNIARGMRKVYRKDRLSAGGKTRGAQISRESVVNYWRDHPEHERFRDIWKSNQYPNALKAIERLNAEADKRGFQRIGSIDSARRAFGRRMKR